jgi:ABC-type sulfate transport system substrate-binding protein
MRNNSGKVPAQAGNRWKRIIGALWQRALTAGAASAARTTLPNVSFDVSRQLFQQILFTFADPLEGGAITNKTFSRAHRTAGGT